MFDRVILFTGDIETLEFFSKQLGSYFEKEGYGVFYFDFLKEQQSFRKMKRFVKPNSTIMITFNFIGIRNDEIFKLNGNSLFFDAYHIPCFNIVVDHPFYYHELLGIRPKNYYQFCIDYDHIAYMNRFFPDIPMAPFLPLGGTSLFESPEAWEHGKALWLPMKERKMDIVFAGNYVPPSNFDQYITRLDDEYTAFYHGILDDLIAHPGLSMERVFETHLRREMVGLSDEDLKECMGKMIFLDLYIRFYFREKVVKTLVDNGFPVHVFGKGWEQFPCRHPENLVQGGSLNSHDCLKKISEGKLSLNVMPWFKNGAHDRIFNSMLNGSVSLSDPSAYLEKEFSDGTDIAFYSLEHLKELPALAENLLKSDDTLESIALQAYKKAAASHTWANRGKAMERFAFSVLQH